MEHEKKKRQKKKKNKQQGKPNAGVGEPMSENNNHANETKQNHENLTPENSDAHNKSVMDSDRESISGAETVNLNREASLLQKIKELQERLDIHVLREADLERKISQSQNKRNLCVDDHQTEFETRISQLQTEKDSWLQKENLSAETISSLNKENARLQAQVMEMKSQLEEHVSKIQNLENSVPKNEELESARALIEKLVSENEKLIEKVNYLNAELDRKSITTDSSFFPIKPKNSKSGDVDETSLSSSSSSAEKLELPKERMTSDKIMEEPMKDEDLNRISRASMESGEIVQISLDDGIVPVSEKGGDAVSLTDAPLIGAPFRFISLVARYVSGADLVEKS